MSIGKIKMKGTKPVMEVTKVPRDTEEFEKVEIPNPTVQKAINKVNNKIPTIQTTEGWKWKINYDAETPSKKDMERYNHWMRHKNGSAFYSNLNKQGITPKDVDDAKVITSEPTRGYKHYKENVDADKELYDYLMDATGGNGEKKK